MPARLTTPGRRTARRLATTVALAATVAGPAAIATPAASAAPSCHRPAKVVASDVGNYLYRKGVSLWACTTYYGEAPVVHRLGRWSQGHSKVAFDGAHAVWTTAGPKIEGVPVDRIWAADATTGKVWMKGLRPVLAGTALDDTDNTISALRVEGEAAGWVTASGAVMMGVQSPDGSGAEPVGAGTTAAAPAPLLGVPQGLAAPLTPKGHRLFVGRWTNVSPRKLARSLRLTAGDGEGDECGGIVPWSLTVQPLAGEPAVGATQMSWWQASSDACSG